MVFRLFVLYKTELSNLSEDIDMDMVCLAVLTSLSSLPGRTLNLIASGLEVLR